jgi:hypothetical protein
MAKSVVRITTACALALLASCQLNDHDSAPRAPDLPYDDDQVEQGPSPSVADSNRGTRTPTAGSDAAAPDNDVPPLPGVGSGDGGADAGLNPPPLPPVLLLDAGTLPPGNFGGVGDAALMNTPPLAGDI